MKTQTTKKPFAFIIMMMFFSLTQFASGQKKCTSTTPCPAGYTCVNGQCQVIISVCHCATRGYGCYGNPKCLNYCSGYCSFFSGKHVPVNGTDLTVISANPFSQSATISFALTQSEKNSTKILDITAGSLKISVDSKMQQFIRQIEWNVSYENGNENNLGIIF